MTSPRNIGPLRSAGPSGLPLPLAPGFAFQPARPPASGPRLAVGLLQALASAVVGCGWLYLTWLMLAFGAGSPGNGRFWLVMGAIGVAIVLSGLGGLGTAATAGRPMQDRWARAWVWMSCLCGGLPVAIGLAVALWIQAFHA